MRRIYPDYVYTEEPRAGCFWDTTCAVPAGGPLRGDVSVDVAIVGAGFTGLNAALELARSGASVAVLDAKPPGWGVSGRNGGFCCLGGGKVSDKVLDRRCGKDARLQWRRTEIAAVDHVASFLKQTGTDADVHSRGETLLAHRAKDVRVLEQEARSAEENYGTSGEVISASDLNTQGLSAGFHGGMTLPIGFGLNPRKYLAGLVQTSLDQGALIYHDAQVEQIARTGQHWTLHSAGHQVQAQQVIIATNGYSSEDLPNWLAGRYMPTQSSVAVTRPLTQAELAAQNWTSDQMCYDTRNLLHYFRLMPDRRMLFGLRGGLRGTPASNTRAFERLKKDFVQMFPAWADVDLTHHWSGMVCLTRNSMPFVGEIPGNSGMFCAMGYHGNGVAMGSYAGHLVARLAADGAHNTVPMAMSSPLQSFPYGRARRALLWPAYAMLKLADR